MHGIESQIIDWMHAWFDAMGWAGVMLAMTIESACIPLPSEIIMPLTGWMIVSERALGWNGIFLASLVGAIGNLIGAVITYWIGATLGRPFIERWGKYVLLAPHDIDLAHRWFERWGEIATLVGRLLPVVRTFISVPAGIARMNFPKFCLFTFVGSFLWCIPLTWAGYHWGPDWESFRERVSIADYPIAAIVVLVVAWFIWHRIRAIRGVDHPGSTTA